MSSFVLACVASAAMSWDSITTGLLLDEPRGFLEGCLPCSSVRFFGPAELHCCDLESADVLPVKVTTSAACSWFLLLLVEPAGRFLGGMSKVRLKIRPSRLFETEMQICRVPVFSEATRTPWKNTKETAVGLEGKNHAQLLGCISSSFYTHKPTKKRKDIASVSVSAATRNQHA
jgi:hypothetical protein